MMKYHSAGLALICFTAAAVANAQMSLPTINPNIISTATQTDVMGQRLQEIVAEQNAQRDGPAIVVNAQLPDFSFIPSTDRTRQNLQAFIKRTPNPAARADLEQMFAAQPTLIDDINGAMRGYGFDPHNSADAYAAWWITVWGIANKQNIEPDAATVTAVKQQVRNAFAATPQFATASDAQRQEYAEALLLQAAMMGSSFEQWKDDPKLIDQLAEAARKGAKESGLDLSLMTLTSQGFVPRKGADASDVVEGADDTIRNARADTPAAEGESFGLGLALAAGAGLGVTLLGGLALMRRG